jgi:hypothetical protein
MSSYKKILVMAAAGVAGGLIGSLFILPITIRTNFLNTADILTKVASQQPKNTQNEPKINPVSSSDYSEAISNVSPSVVAVQSFLGGELLRSGSGIMLTQDGLAATLNSLVPANADFFQIKINGGIYKAKVVFRSFKSNVALVSIAGADDYQVASLEMNLPKLGQHLLIFAKSESVNKDLPLVEETLVSQLDDSGQQFKILLAPDQEFYGASVVNDSGSILGLIDFQNQKPVIIGSTNINAVLTGALTKFPNL